MAGGDVTTVPVRTSLAEFIFVDQGHIGVSLPEIVSARRSDHTSTDDNNLASLLAYAFTCHFSIQSLIPVRNGSS